MNSVAAVVVQAAPRAAWRSAAEVFKPRIALEIMLAGLAGLALAGGSGLAWWPLLVFSVAIFLAAASAGALNHLAERDIDARMSRTRRRPFVTGALAGGRAWYALIALLVTAAVWAAAWAGGALAAAYVFLGAFTYGVVYTLWLKRRTWLNIVVGGLAGSFAVLAGGAVVDPVPGPAVLSFAVVLFLWTPPHFWSLAMYCRDDYANAGVPMLPVVFGDRVAAQAILWHTVLLSLLSLLPVLIGGAGWIYGLAAVTGGAHFTWRAAVLARSRTRGNAIRCFLASLLQLGVLLLGAIFEGAVRGSLVQW
jgi:protoheme IX farnesyltransferase